MTTSKNYPGGLLGKKLGMTQVFTAEGRSVPVTVIQAGPCFVLDVRAQEKDGYSAVQFGFEPKKMQRCSSAENGHFKKAGQGAFYHVKEVRCDAQALGWNEVGKQVTVADVFKDGEVVDVSGLTIGRGFQGVVRRHGFKGQPMTRGTHEVRRHVGSIGCRKFPGRVFKNKKMPGRMGGEKVTIQNLTVVGVRPEENILLVKGGIPGARGSLVVIQKAQKRA
jgi:large subunit ribosomal protein L3